MSQDVWIPFNQPFMIGGELDNIREAIERKQLAGNGYFTQRCQALLQERLGAARVLLTHSCTAALEMAALLFEVGPGDEVVLPSFTFVSTANAFALRGARLRFVDVLPDTLDMDPAQAAAALGPRTRVICPVHYAGVGCEMDPLLAAAEEAGAWVVEDAAQGVHAWYRDRPLGALGHLGAFSFHETKNCIAGEGGALVVNDPRLAERAEILWEKGTNRTQFLEGRVDKYTWVDVGSSFLPSELTAAFLYAQLLHTDEVTARRLAIWERYRRGLAPLEARGDLRLPRVPDHCRHNAHMFYVLTGSPDERRRLIAHLEAAQVKAVFHYVPLHSSPMGQKLAAEVPELPVTDDVAGRLLRLPLFYELTDAQVDRVVAAVGAFYGAPAGT